LSRDKMAKAEEDTGGLEFTVITNDGTARHSMQLMTLKNIFSKQLPKMPKEYIVRLVFDRKHRSMVILKEGNIVVGGICYRPYYPQAFAEIAFCAITASEQVKGYGTRLMNHVKEHVKKEGITHFLTYADNYAIGYFRKQGFSKNVSMDKDRWLGYIKDYDGGTLMECAINMHVNYLNIPGVVQLQRDYLLQEIRKRSNSHVIYPGLDQLLKDGGGRIADIFSIPGIKEAGWSPAAVRSLRAGKREEGSLKTQLQQIVKRVSTHRSAWPFHEPVDTNLVTDYLDVIQDPIDLSLITKRVKSGDYYLSKIMLRADLDRMCDNCLLYNAPDTNYYKAAVDLKAFIKEKMGDNTTVKGK